MKRLLAYLFIFLGLELTFSVNAGAIIGKRLCIIVLIKGSTTTNVTKFKNINIGLLFLLLPPYSRQNYLHKTTFAPNSITS
tara:strand:+ start:414 stop:656 length:243 start_codon:yes stop_codon:yes gene_type:complete